MESSPTFEQGRGELREDGLPLPPPRSRDRDGLSALERKALYRVHTELPAMPASLVVQILLWPEKITDWARDENVTPALVYNMLGGFKPYHGLRQRLAERLGVTKGAVDHLIDARRQQPSSRRIPEPPVEFSPDDVALAPTRAAPGSAEGTSGETSTDLTATREPASGEQQAQPGVGEGSDQPPPSDDRQIALDF